MQELNNINLQFNQYLDQLSQAQSDIEIDKSTGEIYTLLFKCDEKAKKTLESQFINFTNSLLEKGKISDLQLRAFKRLVKDFVFLTSNTSLGNLLVRIENLSKSVMNPQSQVGEEKTPLELALEQGDLNECLTLLKSGVDFSSVNTKKETALHVAINYGRDTLCTWLLQHFPKMKSIKTPTDIRYLEGGISPLMLAVKKGHLPLCKTLIDLEVDPFAIDDKQRNALHHAAISGQDDVCKWLVEKFPALIDTCDLEGKTPLMKAIRHGKLSTCEVLLHHGATTEVGDINVLVLAVGYGHVEICKALLSHDPSLIEKRDKLGYSPLSMATLKCDQELYDFLCSQGARPESLRGLEGTILKGKITLNPLMLAESERLPLKGPLQRLKETQSKTEKVFNATMISVKQMSHLFEMDGTATITAGDKTKYELELESFSPMHFLKKISESLLQLSELYPFSKNSEKTIKSLQSAFEASADLSDQSIDQMFENWKLGKPVILSTGFHEHSTKVLLKDNYFIVCDRAQESPIRVFEFDKENLNINVLITLLNLKFQSTKKYVKFFMEFFPKKLNPNSSLKTSILQDHLNYYIKKQKVGNCSWASAEGILFAGLLLNAYQDIDGFSKEKALPALEQILSLFNSWKELQGIIFLEEYLKTSHSNSGPSFKVDEGVLHAAFCRGYPSRSPLALQKILKERWHTALKNMSFRFSAKVKANVIAVPFLLGPNHLLFRSYLPEFIF